MVKQATALLDSQIHFHEDLPEAGEGMESYLSLKTFFMSKGKIVVFYKYEAFSLEDNRHLFTIKGTGGVFSKEDLNNSKGIIKPPRSAMPEKTGLILPIGRETTKTSLNDMELSAVQDGDLASVLGDHYPQFPVGDLIYGEYFKMIDRILEVDLKGGDYQCGLVVSEYDIKDDHWVFDCHFKNDPIFPGSMMFEGINQTGNFLFFYIGVEGLFDKPFGTVKFRPVTKIASKTKFRGQIAKKNSKLKYEIHVKEVNRYVENGKLFTDVITDAKIFYEGRMIAFSQDLGFGVSQEV